MNILNIEEKKLSIIMPFKNGHTLLKITFIHLFKHFNIDVEFESEQIKFLNNSHIFVRNPIDRFFSSYYWLEHTSKLPTDIYNQSVVDIIKRANIYNLSDYIKNYDIFIDICNDYHFIPQSSQILQNKIITNQADIKLLYENKFGPNYRFFKIEDIDTIIEKNTKNLLSKNIVFDLNLVTNTFNINKFDFLNDFPNEVSFLFMTFYFYFKNLIEYPLYHKHHKHINYIEKITSQEYSMVCKITKNECDFFGYNEKVIDGKLFKKN